MPWIASQEGQTIAIECNGIENELINFLENWAKNHLSRIDKKHELNVVSAFSLKGHPKFENVSLEKLLKRVDFNNN